MCMDSRSGPELSNKVHGFDETVKHHHPFPAGASCNRFAWVSGLVFASVVACGGGSDPRELEGALSRAADALAQRDAADLFRVIDQRARHAMASITESRRNAATLIRKSYPTALQGQALSELGDAAGARDASDLFRLRCDATCLDGLSQQVGAPVETRQEGVEIVVKTARGGELRMYRGNDTWYGIVWNTEALRRERDRAAAELDQVKSNAALYDEQRKLHP